MSQRYDVITSESRDAIAPCNRVRMRVGVLRLFESQTRMLVAAQMTIVSMLLGHPMSMRGTVMELGGSPMVFVTRSVVGARRHI